MPKIKGKRLEKAKAKLLKDLERTLKEIEGIDIDYENRDECDHTELRKISNGDAIYQCKNCKMIAFVYGSAMYWPENYIGQVAKSIENMEV